MSSWKEDLLRPQEWTDYSQAVQAVEEELGISKAEADALFRQALAEGKIAFSDHNPEQPLSASGDVLSARRADECSPMLPPAHPAYLEEGEESPPIRAKRVPRDADPKPLAHRIDRDPSPRPSRRVPRDVTPGKSTGGAAQVALKALEEALEGELAHAPPMPELWIHIPKEKRWLQISRTDLHRWFNEPAQQAVGKRPRIKSHLTKLYPDGVPDPAFCPRKELRAELLKEDPRLSPLDEATLKTAIEEYNGSIRNDPKGSEVIRNRTVSD